MVEHELPKLGVEGSIPSTRSNFYKLLPKSTRYGIDLAPAHPDVIEQNFFDYKPDSVGNILTIGNPPFGKNSSLAVKFFNHAAQFKKNQIKIL